MKPSRPARWKSLVVLATALAAGVVGKGYTDVRRQLLNGAVITAVKKNNAATVEDLLSEGADPNAKDLSPDMRPLWQQLWDRLRGEPLPSGEAPSALLVALEPNDAGEETPENVPLVKALLDAGADINATDGNGCTPLILAALSLLKRKQETVKLLLARGARVDTRDHAGETALDWDAYLGDSVEVQCLLDRGALVNLRANDGSNSLCWAAMGGQTSNVRLLVAKGADVNAPGRRGSPLVLAAQRSDTANVKILLANGAQVNFKDDTGHTALKWAQENHNPEIVSLLKKAGTKE